MYLFLWLQQFLVAAHGIIDLPWVVQDLLAEACRVYFPDQGLNPGPLHWDHSLSHWTTREVPPDPFLLNGISPALI